MHVLRDVILLLCNCVTNDCCSQICQYKHQNSFYYLSITANRFNFKIFRWSLPSSAFRIIELSYNPGFDEQINASREEAEQAMANADAIEDKITQANEMTEQTRNALGTARSVATQASGRAMQALDNAEEIQDVSKALLYFEVSGRTPNSYINCIIKHHELPLKSLSLLSG